MSTFQEFEHDTIHRLHNLITNSAGVCTDTREIKCDSIFFALKGENFNGNDFIVKALEQGALYAVTDDAKFDGHDYIETIAGSKYADRIIKVDNVLQTLQQLAKYHRLKYRIPVIALTGSNGKTTTKELISCALRKKYNVISTEGNLNNHIGVPLTLLKIKEDTQLAVVEMGASAPKEIDTLVKIVCPSFGLITSIGKSHLQGFGSIEGVIATKGELYDNLQENKKIAFVNIDNPILAAMIAERPDLQVVPYGMKNDMATIVAAEQNGDPSLKLIIPNPEYGSPINKEFDNKDKEILICTNLIGDYNADNVLAAICVGTHFGISLKECIEAIHDYSPSNNRSQMIKTDDNTLIVDAYNANPSSMQVALENFAKLKLNNKVLILGDMLELGTDSILEHKNILQYAISINPLRTILVGSEFSKAYHEFFESETAEIKIYDNCALLRQDLQKEMPHGITFLIKGSHGIHLERLIDIFIK